MSPFALGHLVACLLAAPLLAQGSQRVPVPPCHHPPPGAKLWSDPASWPGGAIPQAGECAAIAAGDTLYLDVSPPPLGGLDVAGTLIFACADLDLAADWIRVTGRLEVGTSVQPFRHRATITLTASFACDPSRPLRALMIEDAGVLALHGAQRGPSWLRLAQTAHAGESVLHLDATVAWKPGDRVVIASSDFDPAQAEERTLVAVAGDLVVLDQPLAFTHWGEIEGLAIDGVGVDERSEVALLTRDVVVQGTPALDVQGRTLAGQVVLRYPLSQAPRAEIERAEFRDLGMEGIYGGPTLRFEMLGDAAGSYVRDASFHRTWNRAVAIRGSRGVVVEGCVAFDVIGHAYYMEDDGARDCTLRRDLGLRVRASHPGFEPEPTDLHPAVFWLHHPSNVVEDCAAAGSDGYGYWFDVENGESTAPASFVRNVAHSCTDSGFFQDHRPAPASTASYVDLTAWKNRRFGIWVRSFGASEIVRLRAADNRGAVYLASEGFQNDFVALTGIATLVLRDSLVLGESANTGLPLLPHELAAGRSLPQTAANPPGSFVPAWHVLTGVEVYDGLMGIEDTTFAGFADLSVPGVIDRKAAAFTQVYLDSPWAVDPRNWVRGLRFVNANRLWWRDPVGEHWIGTLHMGDNGIANTTLYDLDGSLTGVPASWVLAPNPFLVPAAGAVFAPTWNAYLVPAGRAVGFAQLEFFNLVPLFSGVPGPDSMTLSSAARGTSFETISVPHNPSPLASHRFATNIATEDVYVYTYDAATPVSDWSKEFTVSFQFTEPGRWAIASVPLPPITGGTVDLDGAPAPFVASFAELLASPDSACFYDPLAPAVHFKFVAGDLGGPAPALFRGTRRTFLVIAK